MNTKHKSTLRHIESFFNMNVANSPKCSTTSPPLEAVLLTSTILFYGLWSFPRIFNGLESVATVEIISTPLFDDVISKRTLAYIRLAISTLFLTVTIYRWNKMGHSLTVQYLKHSKLKRLAINLDGIRSQIMFTQWSFNALTMSFFLNGIITLTVAHQEETGHKTGYSHIIDSLLLDKTWPRIAILLFEIAGPTSMLVSTVTKYALWPQAMKGPRGSVNLRKPVSLLQHNANIIASLLEVGVLGRIPVRLEDFIIAPTFGTIYVFFTWALKDRLVETKEPQFVYFFFDTTLGKKWTITVLLVLLTLLMVFYLAFAFIDDCLIWLDCGIVTNTIMVIGLAAFFCRFRD
mmetsp:Transcript_9727/g.18264  ORF Transcript_9727/g.18264 Transcript_9727/m.18264 type:complete len:347 (+) Transcript_9727:2-1042(+)